ncbi:MAG: hypothetical protein HN474_06460 [Nitrospina sp.]|nr:hypothetical protein [Nitrospina sp.]
MRIILAIIFSLMLTQVSFFSKAEAGDEEYHKKILEALKRMNIRLVRLEANKMESLKSVQNSLLNQIMAMRTSIEQIQATGELNKSEMLASVKGLKNKILTVESHLKNEVMIALDGQRQDNKRYQEQFSTALSQLKDSLATDMEGLSKANQQQFNVFSETNNKQLQQIVNALEDQNRKLLQTQALFKTDLIPALDTQGDETRRALVTELSQARAIQENFFDSRHKQTLASLGTLQEKNKALIGVLKKIILIDETTSKNVDQTKKMIVILQEVLVQRMKNIAEAEANLKVHLDKGLIDIKGNQKKTTSQLERMVSSSDKLKKQSTQIEKSIQLSEANISSQSSQLGQSLGQRIDSARAQSELSNEKLSRLIDILKSFAVEQEKIDKALQTFSVNQGKSEQILQGQKKLDVTQKKITEALKDLRRKANVNISRSEDILKKIKKKK